MTDEDPIRLSEAQTLIVRRSTPEALELVSTYER